MVDDDSENDQSRRDHGDEPSSKRARVPKRGRKSSTDLYATSSATNSDDGSKYNRTNADLDATGESHYSRAERQRHKSKQQQQQQKLPVSCCGINYPIASKANLIFPSFPFANMNSN